MAYPGNALGDDKVHRQMLVTGVEKITKIENLKNDILEPLASSSAAESRTNGGPAVNLQAGFRRVTRRAELLLVTRLIMTA